VSARVVACVTFRHCARRRRRRALTTSDVDAEHKTKPGHMLAVCFSSVCRPACCFRRLLYVKSCGRCRSMRPRCGLRVRLVDFGWTTATLFCMVSPRHLSPALQDAYRTPQPAWSLAAAEGVTTSLRSCGNYTG